MVYLPVIGLEIHIQVKTKSKMFCRCSAEYFGSPENTNVCPVCFGLPGALPVPNKEAFNKAIMLALALKSKINQKTKFDRKNYFYPDLPKGYQISQYDQPIGYDGFVEIEVNSDARRVRIQRVHLEEDTGKSLTSSENTFIDYNKSGVALIEVVTYPDFESTEEVILFAKRLKQIVRYLDVSDTEMQKGQMRFELNISLKPDTSPVGFLPDYKVEVKNIGSISVLEKVLLFETKRQEELLLKGEKILPQTRGLKDMSGETIFQRSKESSDDYRYFPEPDIPPLNVSDEEIIKIQNSLPELPHERKQRYISLGLEGEQADVFVENTDKGEWFDNILKILGENSGYQLDIAKWIIGEISGQLEKRGIQIKLSPLKAEDLIYLVKMVREKKISGTIVKNVINQIFNDDGKISAEEIIKTHGLIQISDNSEVEKFARDVLQNNLKVVEELKKNPNAIKFLVGQVMKISKGKVNPKVAEEILQSLIQNA